MYKERIRCKQLFEKVVSAEEAAMMIQDGMLVGASGFTACGYPKAVPLALAKQAREGRKINIELLTGASVGIELDGEMTDAGVIAKRVPYHTNNAIRIAINEGKVNYVDQHLSHTAQQVRYKFFGNIDVALVEAVAITEDGHIIPSTSVGNTPTFVKEADMVIVEINTSQPLQLEGMHDIYIPEDPPCRQAIPLFHPGDRIGTPYIPCGPEKIKAIVLTDITDKVNPLVEIDDTNRAIAQNLINFLKNEVKAGRMPKNLLPIQSGVGNVGNAFLAVLHESDLENLTLYTEVIQDSVFDLIDAGKFKVVSGTSLAPSPNGLIRFKEKIDFYKDKIILRPQEISNSPEIVRRLGLISINTGIEADIYGNVNSSHIMGTKIMNGVGGSGDFTRNGYISIFLTTSTAKNKDISCIVPMVSHVDHTEHDVCVIVTEQGVADLRNKSPKERALEIINNCAHPDYRNILLEYFKEAVKLTNNCHTPHVMGQCHRFHERFLKTGTMRI